MNFFCSTRFYPPVPSAYKLHVQIGVTFTARVHRNSINKNDKKKNNLLPNAYRISVVFFVFFFVICLAFRFVDLKNRVKPTDTTGNNTFNKPWTSFSLSNGRAFNLMNSLLIHGLLDFFFFFCHLSAGFTRFSNQRTAAVFFSLSNTSIIVSC